MRDAGHRTPDAGHRTAKKAKIIYPPPRGVDIKKVRQIQVSYSHKRIYLWPSTYMQDMREIPAIVTEKIVIKS